MYIARSCFLQVAKVIEKNEKHHTKLLTYFRSFKISKKIEHSESNEMYAFIS